MQILPNWRVTALAYNAAGATAIFENRPLERHSRDIHTVTQQLQGQLRHFETVGAWMMGVETDLSFVWGKGDRRRG